MKAEPPALPGIEEVRRAAQRLAGRALRTPLIESPVVNARLGGRLLIKAETLQRTGSFKFRGAMNALLQLGERERLAGVVAFSSGNHAQGVAAAAQMLEIPAVIVMPADAPAIKVANTRAYGAEVVLYDRYRESREAIAARLAAERGARLIPPYDDARVIAGQGTVGLELVEQARAMGAVLDALVVPVSGGGLIAGAALALAADSPATQVYSAEPAGFEDLCRSLAAGERVANDGALDLRRAVGADAGRDHLRHQPPPARGRPRCRRRGGVASDGRGIQRLQARGRARRRRGVGSAA
jgi:threonine dehydratase